MNILIKKLHESFLKNTDNICFRMDEKTYSYGEVLNFASQIRLQIQEIKEQNIGLYLTNEIFMYAAILAIWFEGKTYVPIHPDFPANKNLKILGDAEISTIISPIELPVDFQSFKHINSTKNFGAEITEPKDFSEEQNAYILFTSGSTGDPKGVPISFSNLYYFTESYYDTFGEIFPEDRVLQMFELTFDVSVVSYLIPWLNGASIVTLNKKEAKFLQILDLLEANEITVAQMVPSILNLMVPYLDPEIKNTSLRSAFVAGEALLSKQTQQWRSFVPNAKLYNSYGPTENTIICITYEIESEPKEKFGIISIGKAMLHNHIRFLNDEENEGELLLSGKLLTKNYWKNEQKDRETFIEIDGTRYYKTGDWCARDEEGNIYYKNRIDFQVKINGFRVELTEIEHFANEFLTNGISVAIAKKDENDNDFLALFVNDPSVDETQLSTHIKQNVPDYMVPSKIIKIETFPVNTSGKIDRNALKNLA